MTSLIRTARWFESSLDHKGRIYKPIIIIKTMVKKKDEANEEQETVIVTEEILETYPNLASKGWAVGQKMPQSIIDEEKAAQKGK